MIYKTKSQFDVLIVIKKYNADCLFLKFSLSKSMSEIKLIETSVDGKHDKPKMDNPPPKFIKSILPVYLM